MISLPFCFAALEELSEMLVQKQLGYSNKPIVLLNTDGFYDGLIKFFDEIIDKNFATKNSKELYYVARTPQDALLYINNYEFRQTNYITEKLLIKS